MTRHIKEHEQEKEAEVVRLRTPPRKICIDLMTGTICDPEPIEHGGHVIPFTAPRSGLRGKANSYERRQGRGLVHRKDVDSANEGGHSGGRSRRIVATLNQRLPLFK